MLPKKEDKLVPAIEALRPDVVLATPPPISHRTAEENLGLGYIASALRHDGRVVEIVDGWLRGLDSHQLASEILKLSPKTFIGFSCYRSNIGRTMEVANLLRTFGLVIPLVAGGYGPTFEPEEFLKAFVAFLEGGEG